MKTAILSGDSELPKQDPDKKMLLLKLEKNHQQELETMIMCQEKEEQLICARTKLVLSQIRLNAAKHAHILQVLIDLISEDIPENQWDYRLYRYVSQNTTEYAVQRDLKVEENLLQTYQDVITQMDDPGIKMLLRFVIQDEKSYQKSLRNVIIRLSTLNFS